MSAAADDAKSSADRAAGAGSFLLAQLGSYAAMRFAERIAALGLTPAHAGLLRAIASEPGRSQRAIATQLGVLPSKLVLLVDELETEGLVERRQNPDDRRNYALHLTAKGNRSLRELAKVAAAHSRDLLAPLSESDRVHLTAMLATLAAEHGLTPGVHPGYRAL